MEDIFKSPFFGDITMTAEKSNRISPETYNSFKIKRGLRNRNGTGVKVGLTKVGAVKGYRMVKDKKEPMDGELYYRGIDIRNFVKGFQSRGDFGFEECVYLLLLGKLPTAKELTDFKNLLGELRKLPPHFTENMILKIPSKDIMNKLQRSILVLYSHDDRPDDTDIENLLMQSIRLIARFPTIISYGYQAKAHNFDNKSLFIHPPQPELSTAENILYMIRGDNRYTELEAEILDLCLVIHAEHGGGNNSAFTTHVVSSSGTDTYSAIAAAVGSLKGPKHGGANIRVKEMIEDIKSSINWRDRDELKEYLNKILDKKVYNKKGLIYGMGHAVYTKQDPRAEILKQKAYELAVQSDAVDTYDLYSDIEKITKEIFIERKGDGVDICANVDLYSGFVYELLNIPKDLYTPLFAAARLPGWCAHRIEQIMSDKKILRPAYETVSAIEQYVEIHDR